jgi:hypothetical protein
MHVLVFFTLGGSQAAYKTVFIPRLMRQAYVRGYPKEPGTEFTPEFKFFQVFIHSDKDFLIDIFGVIGALHIVRDNRQDPPVIPVHQVGKSSLAAVPRLYNQVIIAL